MSEAKYKEHIVRPGEKTLQLKIPVVLPGVERADDGCISRLSARISSQTGVSSAHITNEGDGPMLCLHYDPNLVSLPKLERLVQDEGAQITQRFKHETFPIKGMAQGTNVSNIEDAIRAVPGVLTVTVNYAAEKMWVEYDSTLCNKNDISKALAKLGYAAKDAHSHEHENHADHDHEGHADHDHQDHSHEDHEGDAHAGHSHGPIDPNANWFRRNPEVSLSLLSGLLLAVGYFGENYFGLPAAVALGLYLCSYVAGGADLARHTVPTVIRGRFDVEFLMLLGAIGAGILGEWAEGAFLLFLFSFGHALEHFAMDSARDAIGALGKLTPKTARVRRDGAEIEIPVEKLQIGDTALVRPGDRIAVDGKITSGRSAIDQSPITGESVPVEKTAGEGVFAGSINGDGALEVEVTKLANDTTLARVMKMVEEAQSQKSPTQTFTDKFEKIFVPAVLVVVVIAAIVPPLAGWLEWKVALFRAISTVVAASPCALALATPSAVLSGIARAAQNGVLIKGGVHLENLGTLQAIAFDKTGTLTRGRPEVADLIAADGISQDELLALTASVETRSSHPLAQAVVRAAHEKGLELRGAGELQNVQGRGVFSVVDGQTVRIGNLKMIQEAGITIPSDIEKSLETMGQSGKPTMLVARDAKVLGVISLADQIRPESKTALEKLRSIGITSLIMLTGDNERVAANIAPQVGVTEFRGDLLPENKVEALQSLLKEKGAVAMVGDGVNDAPALANATVGIAMGAGGTDVALETADVALMGDDLGKLPFAVALSRQAKSIIQQNLWVSLGVIAILVPSTLFGFTRLGVAVIFHEGSTLVVVANALRLLRFKLRD